VGETSSPLKNLKFTEQIKSHSAASSLDLANQEIGNVSTCFLVKNCKTHACFICSQLAIAILEKSARTVGEIKFL